MALVCASSAVPEERLEPAVAAVKALGLEPVVYPTCYYVNRHGNFAATDAQRAKDLMDAFLDPDIAGVLSIRGGYGAGRLLPLLDLDAMAATGKFFSGYSDVTALHIPLNNRGLTTWHTVMPSTEFYQKVDDFTMLNLRWALFGDGAGGGRTQNVWELQGVCGSNAGQTQGECLPCALETLVPGVAEGRLVGGNLSLVAASLGTPWEIETDGNILFLEDIGEEPYRIDGMLTHLRNAGKLDHSAGVVLGYWTDCKPADDVPTLPLNDVILELLGGLKCPVLKNIPCGHSLPSMALPLGGRVRLNATLKTLEVLE